MPEIPHIRLSELNDLIHNVVNTAFGAESFWVIADVTSHTFKAQKNYHHLELVEKDPHSNNIIAKIAGKAWGQGAVKIAHFERITGQLSGYALNLGQYMSEVLRRWPELGGPESHGAPAPLRDTPQRDLRPVSSFCSLEVADITGRGALAHLRIGRNLLATAIWSIGIDVIQPRAGGS